jgi:dihydropteroate synthase
MRQRPHFDWRLRTRTLALGERTLLMGILNVTPDSFSDGGRFTEPRAAFDQALRLLDEGADILDLGGESTRPNAVPISATEEQDRVLPVIAAILAARPEAILSVDTYHAATAQATLKAGAENVVMLAGFGQLHALGRPLLAGISRKRFLTAGLGNPDDQARRHATTGANAAAILAGAHLLRVHDVAATHAAASVADAILREQSWRG